MRNLVSDQMSHGLRLAAGLFLLAATGHSVWQTIDILSSRRMRRTELAQISHVRYGLTASAKTSAGNHLQNATGMHNNAD